MTSDTLFPDERWQRCYIDFLASAYAKSGSRSTLSTYTSTLRAFFATAPQKLPDLFSRQEVESFIHGPSRARYGNGKPVSTATMNLRQAVLSAFYRYAAAYTIAGDDGRPTPLLWRAAPTLGMRFRKVKRSFRALSLEEMTRFFAVLPDTPRGKRDRAIFGTLFWTCRRRSEVISLLYGDLEQAVIIDPDGTRRTGTIFYFTSKGKSGVRDSAELPPLAKQMIDDYLVASGRMLTIQPDEALFPAMHRAPYGKDPDLKKPIRPQTVQVALKRYCKLAGIRPCTMHSFRHTGARSRYSEGEDILSIQRLLRHENIATTNIYLTALMGTADPGAKLLEEKYGNL